MIMVLRFFLYGLNIICIIKNDKSNIELSGMICRIGIKIRIKLIRNNRDFIIISDINELLFILNVKMIWLIVIYVYVM